MQCPRDARHASARPSPHEAYRVRASRVDGVIARVCSNVIACVCSNVIACGCSNAAVKTLTHPVLSASFCDTASPASAATLCRVLPLLAGGGLSMRWPQQSDLASVACAFIITHSPLAYLLRFPSSADCDYVACVCARARDDVFCVVCFVLCACVCVCVCMHVLICLCMHVLVPVFVGVREQARR